MTACVSSTPTAAGSLAGSSTPLPYLVASAQADQYLRDAKATMTAGEATQRALAAQIEQTAVASTATAAAQATQTSLTIALTIDSATTQAGATATQQSRLDVQATSQAIATSAQVTAVYQTAVSQATAQSIAASIAATRQTAAIEAQQAQARRDEAVGQAFTLLLFGAVIGLLIFLFWFLWQLLPTLARRAGLVKYGQHGNPLLLQERNGRLTILDPLKMFQAVTTLDEDGRPTMPDLTPAAIQAMMAGGLFHLLAEQARNAPGHAPVLPSELRERKRFGPYEQETTTKHLSSPTSSAPVLLGNTPSTAVLSSHSLPADAPWSLLASPHWQAHGLALGVGCNGILTADPETYPHFLMAGTSGSGKTRYGLRPLIASALVAGWQVTIYDRSGLDFLPFDSHPNAQTVVLPDASQAIGYLAQLYEEILRRFTILRATAVSTWGRLNPAPSPRLLAVMDEFANLADSLPDKQREELWRQARMIAAEGRKAGVHLALALQDPTHKSLDLRIRRNCLPLAFRVKDDSASRVVLGAGGAEQLPPRQFLAVMGDLVRGVAFAPSDEEIRTFLQAHIASPSSPQTWLDEGATMGGTAVPLGEPAEDETTMWIRALLQANKSLREVQKTVFGYTGGAAYEAVRAVKEELVTAVETGGTEG